MKTSSHNCSYLEHSDVWEIFFNAFSFSFSFIPYFWLHWVFVPVRAFSSCGEQGLLFFVVRRLLIVVGSLVAEHGL